MYTALHPIVGPLVEKKETGVLKIHHAYGQIGTFFLREGLVEGIGVGRLSGAPAARKVAAWVSFSSEFNQVDFVKDFQIRGIEARGFLRLLGKVESIVEEIAKVIPGNGATFKTISDKLNGERSFTRKELQVAMTLDGKTPISLIVSESELTELEILCTIKRFSEDGLVELWPAKPIRRQRDRFSVHGASRLAEARL